MKNFDKIIKSYEPMMHKIIRKFKIKRDYEDILQQLRIKTWEVLRDHKYKKYYRNEKGQVIDAKLSTFLYEALTNALLNILKTEYSFKITGKEKSIDELSIDKKIKFFLKNPVLCGLPTMPIETHNTETELKSKLDYEQFYDTQLPEDKQLLALMNINNGDKKEAAKALNCTLRSINRRLLKLKKNYKKFLIGGI